MLENRLGEVAVDGRILKKTLAQVFSCEFYEVSLTTHDYRKRLAYCFYILLLNEDDLALKRS